MRDGPDELTGLPCARREWAATEPAIRIYRGRGRLRSGPRNSPAEDMARSRMLPGSCETHADDAQAHSGAFRVRSLVFAISALARKPAHPLLVDGVRAPLHASPVGVSNRHVRLRE